MGHIALREKETILGVLFMGFDFSNRLTFSGQFSRINQELF